MVTQENDSLYVVDLKTKKTIRGKQLGGEGYSCVLSPDKKLLYISCWGCDKIYIYNTQVGEFSGEIAAGDNPNEICLSKNGVYLFVANANDNSVSVINTSQRKVVETLNASLYPYAPSGSTSNGVALSENQKTLYIANADNNCLAVFDVSSPGHSRSKGFIPTGWYPTNVKVVGHKIFVSNGKGFTSMANPFGPNPVRKEGQVIWHGADTSTKEQYIGNLFTGTLSIIDEPGEQQLGIYSQLVYHNTPYSKEKENLSKGEEGNPVPMRVGEKSPIKYVFYIIKENRTYDQVLLRLSCSAKRSHLTSTNWPKNLYCWTISMSMEKLVPMVTTGAWVLMLPITWKSTGQQIIAVAEVTMTLKARGRSQTTNFLSGMIAKEAA